MKGQLPTRLPNLVQLLSGAEKGSLVKLGLMPKHYNQASNNLFTAGGSKKGMKHQVKPFSWS